MEQHDIARLVMGYLKEDCLDAAAIFAASSPHLYEYRVQTFRNENPSTTVYNMTLKNILHEYKAIHIYVKNKLQETTGFESVYNPKDFITNLETIINKISLPDRDQNGITTLNDSRANNAKIGNNENTENEKSRDAQLVLGYLHKECPNAAVSFAAKSSNLSEYRLQIFQNKISSTSINGMTLINTLQQYCGILTYIQNILKGIFGSKAECNPGSVIKNLEKIILKKGIKSINKQQKQNKISKNDNLKIEKSRIHLTLTKRQETILNTAFRSSNYIRGLKRKSLADESGLTEMQVKQWFQKKRDHENRERLQVQNTSCPVDSSAMICEPGLSTYQAFIENEINICSSSSSTQPIRPGFSF